ncbi:MAG: hypothetical protein LBC87_01340 [Fibromonadaceae bacterium]|jgi:hypothetical protein|nr:hypothetical protein [Fibromonadaceae bacterium]
MKITIAKITIVATLGLALSLMFSCKEKDKQAANIECKELNPETQFCFKDKVYEKCGEEGTGVEYNPETQFCVCEGSAARCNYMILDKCGGKEYNTEVENCLEGEIYSICGDKNYKPSEEDCCYGTIYNSSKQFCSDISFDVADLCGGKKYNIETQFCDNGEVKNSQ